MIQLFREMLGIVGCLNLGEGALENGSGHMILSRLVRAMLRWVEEYLNDFDGLKRRNRLLV